MYPSLRGKRAIVLGGSRGIGRAIALRLAREGVHVLVNYARSADAAEQTAADCRAFGVESEAVPRTWACPKNWTRVSAAEAWVPDILGTTPRRGLSVPRTPLRAPEAPPPDHDGNCSALAGLERRSDYEARVRSNVNLLSPRSDHWIPDYSRWGITKAALSR